MKEEESDEGGSEQTVYGLIYLPISFVFIMSVMWNHGRF